MDKFNTPFEELIYTRTYSRWVEELKRREKWSETVQRYEDFFLNKIPDNDIDKFKDTILSIKKHEIMPSMRCLWTAGKALERENITGYNCAGVVIDDPLAFSEILYILMCGTGCFHKDTKVLTKNGSKEISKITTDDLVLSYNEKEDITEFKKPTNVQETNSKDMEKFEIELTNGYKFKCTYDHEILTDKGYVQAKDLTITDNIFNITHMNYIVRKTKIIEKENYYDITIPDNHNFVLEDGTVVHNCGFSVERQFINKMPTIPSVLKDIDDIIVFKDSKLGWAEGYSKLIRELYKGNILKWDLSKIRPKGKRLKIFGGRASGPEPLDNLLKFTVKMFKSNTGKKLTSIDCHDIVCMIASIVVVGGTRRSATISLSNLSDNRMAHAKDGNYFLMSPYRALANNSVAYTDKPDCLSFLKEWTTLIRSKSGERGIFNRAGIKKHLKKHVKRRNPNFEFITNPCFTGDMKLLTENGYIEFEKLCDTEPMIVNKNNDIVKSKVWCSGEKKTVSVNFRNKPSITCTPNHIFKTVDGEEIQAKDSKGYRLLSYDNVEPPLVSSVTDNGVQKVYDFTEKETHWGYVEGVLVHNCGEVILRSKEFCNLTEVVIRHDDTLEQLLEKVEKATILGCLQATLDNFRFLRKEWTDNIKEERLLGVSLTGLRDHPILNHTHNTAKYWLEEMKDHAIKTSEIWAHKLNINVPKAVTCVKPSGTVSLLNNTASGLHPRFSKYYIRRVRINKTDPLCKMLIDQGINWTVENGETTDNWTTAVFDFPIKAPNNSICNKDVDAIEMLEYWKMIKQHYCEHNPSCTIFVKDDEWIRVGNWVFDNWKKVTGVTFLPLDDNIYSLAPYEEITSEEYDELMKTQPEIDFSKLTEYELRDETKGSFEFACTGNKCEL